MTEVKKRGRKHLKLATMEKMGGRKLGGKEFLGANEGAAELEFGN